MNVVLRVLLAAIAMFAGFDNLVSAQGHSTDHAVVAAVMAADGKGSSQAAKPPVEGCKCDGSDEGNACIGKCLPTIKCVPPAVPPVNADVAQTVEKKQKTQTSNVSTGIKLNEKSQSNCVP